MSVSAHRRCTNPMSGVAGVSSRSGSHGRGQRGGQDARRGGRTAPGTSTVESTVITVPPAACTGSSQAAVAVRERRRRRTTTTR